MILNFWTPWDAGVGAEGPIPLHPTTSSPKNIPYSYPIPAATLGFWAAINPCPSPSGPNTLGGSVELGGTPGGHPHPVPQRCGQAAQIPFPGLISCSARFGTSCFADGLIPSSAAGPVLTTSREYWHHREPVGDTRVDSAQDTEMDNAQGHESGQCPWTGGWMKLMDRRMDNAEGQEGGQRPGTGE